MYEREPYREVIQPPKAIFHASLVSSTGDVIPINNQTAQVFRFENSHSSDFIEIILKANRKRILIDDERVLDTLSEIGCTTLNYRGWDDSHYDHPSHVIAGGEWDVLETESEQSLVQEVEQHGRVISQAAKPEEPLFKIPIEGVVVVYGEGEDALELNYSNTTIVDFDEFPEMAHIRIEEPVSEESVKLLYLFGDEELMDYLDNEKFNCLTCRYPSAQVVQAFLEWQSSNFEDAAAELLTDLDNEK